MTTAQLKICFDGSTPGLAEHKLDLSVFGPALANLSVGLRRIASALIKEAVEQTAGRLARGADLHVFLESLEDGSVGLNMSVSSPPVGVGESARLFDDLPLRVTEQFVMGIEAESRGEMRSVHARKFLRLLPDGVTVQKYQVYSGGQLVYDTTVGAVELPSEPEELPLVIKSTARVVGVNFDPTEVRLDVDGTRLSCAASPAMIDLAIFLRAESVLFLATIQGSKGRLIWLGKPDAFPAALTIEQRAKHVLSHWEKTLEKLSQ